MSKVRSHILKLFFNLIERYTRSLLFKELYKVVILPQISPQQDAQKLYHSLRVLDKKGFDYIIAKLSTIDGIGIAINDRLQKAAHKINN